MKTVTIYLTILVDILIFAGLFAQEMPLVYNVENTGADVPAPPLPSIDELPSIESCPIRLSGLITEAVCRIFQTGATDEQK